MTAAEFSTQLLNLELSLERFAYSLTANREDAKDLLQETFLKALTYKDKFEDNTNLKAWTFTIMKNTFINNYRKNLKQNTTFDTSDNQYLMNSKPDQINPEAEFSHSEISKKVDLLEDEFRIPFQMHNSGFQYKEIAEMLNLKIGTVKSRIFFSRQKLMGSLKDFEYKY